MAINRLSTWKAGAQKSTEPLATCYVRFSIATIIIVTLVSTAIISIIIVTVVSIATIIKMNSKFLEANNNLPLRFLLNKLNLAKNFMMVSALLQ